MKTTYFNNAEEMITTLEHYVMLYNQHIVQRNLGHSTPVQTMKEWYRKKPELFKKRVYNQPGLDIHKYQAGYYQALNDSTAQTDAAPFILFMLQRMHEALAEAAVAESTPQDNPQVTPQVADLLTTLKQAMNREQLQQRLGLSDRKSFRQLYLQPALAHGWLEMTLPDKPNSKNQQYRLTQAGQQLAANLTTKQGKLQLP